MKKQEIENLLMEFTGLANKFFEEGNDKAFEYWKGQVFGICKVVTIMEIDIDTSYWLKQMA